MPRSNRDVTQQTVMQWQQCNQFFTPSNWSQPRMFSAVFLGIQIATILTGAACSVALFRQYTDDNINCLATGGRRRMNHTIYNKAVETYCLQASTYTSSKTSGIYQGFESSSESGELIRHSYYQWVPFMLALQTLVLYVPVWLWFNIESYQLNTLLVGTHRIYVDKEESVKNNKQSAKYFTLTKGSNWVFFVPFVMYEVMALVIAIGNVFVTDLFLGGLFFRFGREALQYMFGETSALTNPLEKIFPRMTMCTWRMFGFTGGLETHQVLCVLPLNIIYEKIYLVLYIGYLAVCSVMVVAALYQLVIFLWPGLLTALLTKVEGADEGVTAERNCKVVLESCDTADKFVLWQLRPHVVQYRQWMEHAAHHDKKKK